MKNKTKLYGAFVWILAGIALLTYGILGLTQTNIPGVEQLVAFVNSAQGGYLYAGAFVAIFLEGLYFIGSFFPGSSLVLLIAIVAQAGGLQQFLLIIGTIFVGWVVAGMVNILGAKYFSHLFRLNPETKAQLENNAEITWFPAFRANTEVAQVTEGHSLKEVFISSTTIKLYASVGAAVYAIIIPFIIDIQNLKNDEGFLGLGVIALINFGIGASKVYEYYKKPMA